MRWRAWFSVLAVVAAPFAAAEEALQGYDRYRFGMTPRGGALCRPGAPGKRRQQL
jgi:hypothetical protein